MFDIPVFQLSPQEGGQSGRRAEWTAWQSQDGVRRWRRLSDAEAKPSGTVTNQGNTEQRQADAGVERDEQGKQFLFSQEYSQIFETHPTPRSNSVCVFRYFDLLDVWFISFCIIVLWNWSCASGGHIQAVPWGWLGTRGRSQLVNLWIPVPANIGRLISRCSSILPRPCCRLLHGPEERSPPLIFGLYCFWGHFLTFFYVFTLRWPSCWLTVLLSRTWRFQTGVSPPSHIQQPFM